MTLPARPRLTARGRGVSPGGPAGSDNSQAKLTTRVRPQITVRGQGVLAAAGGLFGAAKLFGSTELAGLAAAAMTAVVVALVLVRQASMTYRAERWLAPTRVGVGDPAHARLRFTNTGRDGATRRAVAVDRSRPGPAGASGGVRRRAAGAPHGSARAAAGVSGSGADAAEESGCGAAGRCLVPALLPGGMAEARYELPTGRRGVLEVGPLAVRVGDPFGLVERRVEVAGTARLVVHPRIHPVLALPGSPTREARQGSTAPARSPRGDDFFALREYEVGDDLRWVHWRSTARVGDLMLRQDELRVSEVATVLLDTRAAAHRGDSFERALEVAASLAAALVEDGRRLRFVTTGGFDLEFDAARARTPGTRVDGTWATILEHLAQVTPDGARQTAGAPSEMAPEATEEPAGAARRQAGAPSTMAAGMAGGRAAGAPQTAAAGRSGGRPGGAGVSSTWTAGAAGGRPSDADRFALAVQSIRHHPAGPLAAVVGPEVGAAELAALGSLRPRLGLVMVAHCGSGPAADPAPHSAPGVVVVPVGAGDDFAASWNAAVLSSNRREGPHPARGLARPAGQSATGGALGPYRASSATGCAGAQSKSESGVPTTASGAESGRAVASAPTGGRRWLRSGGPARRRRKWWSTGPTGIRRWWAAGERAGGRRWSAGASSSSSSSSSSPRALLALAGVSLIAAAGCAWLFEGAGWVVPALAAVVGAHAVGAVTRWWRAGAVVAAQAAGLLVLVAEQVGGHTAYGVPTPATFSALGRAVARAPEALRAAIVPAPTTPELILVVVIGLWIAAATADALAGRRRAGLAAVLPLVPFPVVVAALGTGRGRLPLTFALAAAIALYAALDRAASLPAVEAAPIRPASVRHSRASLARGGWFAAWRSGTPRRAGARGDGRAAVGGGGGLRVAVVAAVVGVGMAAVVLGPLVPGVGRAVVDVHAFGVTLDVSRVELNPLVDIKPQLLTDRRTELFTVRSAAPAYWRLTALDRFDGRRWSPSRPALYRQDGPAPDTATDENEALHQDFWLSALDSPWLPAAGKAIRVRAAGARLDPETDSLVTKKGSRFVRAYRVESRLPPEPGEAGRSAAGPSAIRTAAAARYLTLPRNFPRGVRELAQRFTAGARTPYERAVALEDSLRVGFVYDERAPAGASMDALSDFLLRSRRGYCEQFAGAYAAMARALGLPTRVAVGFTPGTYDGATGVWRVTTREAHAWPEVHLAGLGWTPFEPTPGRVLPDPDTRMRPSDTAERLASARQAGGVEASALARVDPGGGPGVDAGPGGRAGGWAGAVTHRRTLWWLGAAALGLLALPPAAKTRRRNARRRAPAGAAVVGAWSEALDRLGEAGLARRAEETPLEFAGRAGASRPGVAPALRRLAALVNGAAYGPTGGDRGAEAWAAADRVVRALDAHDPRWVCWRRRLDPRSLRPR